MYVKSLQHTMKEAHELVRGNFKQSIADTRCCKTEECKGICIKSGIWSTASLCDITGQVKEIAQSMDRPVSSRKNIR